jgi:uncharacterized damage-inducible protein DinB
VWADSAWLARFEGRTVTLPPVGTILHEDFAALTRVRAELDENILAWARTVTEAWLQQPYTWTSQLYKSTFNHPTWALVAQLFNHQTHHRGQATT